MKRTSLILTLTVAFVTFCLPIQGQEDVTAISFDSSGQKDFGDFILDMSTMLNTETLTLPTFVPPLDYLALCAPEYPILKIDPKAFTFSPDITYMGGTLSRSFAPFSSFNGSNVNWHGATFKLKNGIRITTYGEYNADGRKIYNPHAMPWQKNNFNAAFEVKSANGNFGIKVEVSAGRNNPY